MATGINISKITPRSVIIQTRSFLSWFVLSTVSTEAVVLELYVTLYVVVVLYEKQMDNPHNVQKENEK